MIQDKKTKAKQSNEGGECVNIVLDYLRSKDVVEVPYRK